MESARRASRGHSLLPCQWLLSLSVDEQAGCFLHSRWLPSPAVLVAAHARHFRELLTASPVSASSAAAANPNTATAAATATPPSVVALCLAPCAYIAHDQHGAHMQLRYAVDERTGEPGEVAREQADRRAECGYAGNRAANALHGLSAIQLVSRCFLGAASQVSAVERSGDGAS